jgi:hypothetical protein
MLSVEKKEAVAEHIAADLDNGTTRIASVANNIITIIIASGYYAYLPFYGDIVDPFWNGPMGLVDYDCHYMPLNLYGRKIRKAKIEGTGRCPALPRSPAPRSFPEPGSIYRQA